SATWTLSISSAGPQRTTTCLIRRKSRSGRGKRWGDSALTRTQCRWMWRWGGGRAGGGRRGAGARGAGRLGSGKWSGGGRVLAGRVDADPYRDAVRDAVLAGDETKIVELAARKDALTLPAGFASFLGDFGAIFVSRRTELLQSALSRRPGDLGLLMTLGGSY